MIYLFCGSICIHFIFSDLFLGLPFLHSDRIMLLKYTLSIVGTETEFFLLLRVISDADP